ncbi:hypothetical protein KFE98_17650 [bacterium SCSIO 12741]|nr:hypothetical protein KFE98_17650 [bacterium SCSIO 12741]
MEIRKIHKDWTGMGNVHLNLGNAYYYLNQTERAIHSCHDALRYYQMTETSPLISKDALNSLGVIYYEIDELDSAKYYYGQCLKQINEGGGQR